MIAIPWLPIFQKTSMYSTVFHAPWNRQLKLTTALSTALLLAIPLILTLKIPESPSTLYSIAIALPLGILLLCALFAIRGYTIRNNILLILRPGWKTAIPLDGLTEAQANPSAMQGSVRLFGNGGLFGYIGLFQNKALGRYRAFATNHDKAVVLRFPTRTLVVTPDRPEQMAELLQQYC
ncbi:PH domain-containing protein [Microbulbifer spongiae]|uniref:PH domain-containing protein n=1 Tax=Microbulbifer spongiae TaxID=2944933 RepID=A0ABY9EGI3_9GAMM|nr:PH domain-containing protein [Microbulbifer sp. MI-G]WKD51196.1 PH domain-containing protein [Microbulbifer sp. MI-G]